MKWHPFRDSAKVHILCLLGHSEKNKKKRKNGMDLWEALGRGRGITIGSLPFVFFKDPTWISISRHPPCDPNTKSVWQKAKGPPPDRRVTLEAMPQSAE